MHWAKSYDFDARGGGEARRCETGTVTLIEPAPARDLPAPASALAAAAAGARLDADQAESLLRVDSTDFERLLELAASVRDEGLAAAGRPGVITYSRKAFLPLLPASFFLAKSLPLSAPAQGARRYLQGCLARLDEQLAGRDWLVGTRSVADPYLLVILRWAADLDIGLYGLEHLMHFARRMEDDPGVQAAIAAEEGVLA